MDCTIRVAITKALISFRVTAKLICVFVFVTIRSNNPVFSRRGSFDGNFRGMILLNFPQETRKNCLGKFCVVSLIRIAT